MSASVEIIGVNQEKLLENLPVQYEALKEKYKRSTQNISAHDLTTIYYQVFSHESDHPEKGFTVLYDNRTKRNCFLLAEAMDYYFCGFDWTKEYHLESFDANYVLSRKQLTGLIEWFVALAEIASDKESNIIRYNNEARYLLYDYYNNIYREYEEDIKLWDWFKPGYENLLSRLQQDDYDYYFYAYSF